MTHTCCPACRLRFTPATASGLEECPCCGEGLAHHTAGSVLGFRLWVRDSAAATAVAAAVAARLDPRRP